MRGRGGRERLLERLPEEGMTCDGHQEEGHQSSSTSGLGGVRRISVILSTSSSEPLQPPATLMSPFPVRLLSGI